MPRKPKTYAPVGPWCDRCHEPIQPGTGIPMGLKERHVDCFLRPHMLPYIVESLQRQEQAVAS